MEFVNLKSFDNKAEIVEALKLYKYHEEFADKITDFIVTILSSQRLTKFIDFLLLK